MNSDLVNGIIEFVGGCFLWLNVWRITKDKDIKGIHWGSVMFWTAFGSWNIYYYPSINQWFSFYGSIFVFLGNTTWVILCFYYKKINKAEQTDNN